MYVINRAAIWKTGGLSSRRQKRVLRRHLRDHFDIKTFESEKKAMMLCEGRTKIYSGTYDCYKNGIEVPEVVQFTEKDFADELIVQLECYLQSKKPLSAKH